MSTQPVHAPADTESKTHCPAKGHSYFLFGREANGGCCECRRIRDKQNRKTIAERKRLALIARKAKARGGREHGQQYRRGYETQAAVEAMNGEILALIDKHELSSAAEWREIKAQIAELTAKKDKLERGEG